VQLLIEVTFTSARCIVLKGVQIQEEMSEIHTLSIKMQTFVRLQ